MKKEQFLVLRQSQKNYNMYKKKQKNKLTLIP